jgi:hypothetical protein
MGNISWPFFPLELPQHFSVFLASLVGLKLVAGVKITGSFDTRNQTPRQEHRLLTKYYLEAFLNVAAQVGTESLRLFAIGISDMPYLGSR